MRKSWPLVNPPSKMGCCGEKRSKIVGESKSKSAQQWNTRRLVVWNRRKNALLSIGTLIGSSTVSPAFLLTLILNMLHYIGRRRWAM